MNAPSLFVGLVSHEGTAYPQSLGSRGLASTFCDAVPDAELRVNTANLYSGVPISSAMVRRAKRAELRLERRWSAYLGGSLRYSLILAARSVKGLLRSAGPQNLPALRRLLNIEYSHRDLMGAGLESGAPWILILEDDASCAAIADLAAGVRGLMKANNPAAYVNLSRSFRVRDLRVEHLLQPVGVSWVGDVPRSVFSADKPVTNTVCAVLYSRSFLKRMLEVWDAMPIDPVVPIDWKLNAVLMALHDSEAFPRDGCWFVEPAPITQGSLNNGGRIRA